MTVTSKDIQMIAHPEPVHQRFNAFHLEVGVFSDRLAWVLSKFDDSSPEASILLLLHEDLERLLSEQDCTPDNLPVTVTV